jgi:hypothetical protein
MADDPTADGIKQQARGREACPHCGDDTGTCVTLRCSKCERLLCSRQVTPVLPANPFYPYKHREGGHTCGPVHPVLLPPADGPR